MKTGKKIMAFALAAALIFSMCGCAGPNKTLRGLIEKNPANATVNDAKLVFDAIGEKTLDAAGTGSFDLTQLLDYLMYGELPEVSADAENLLAARDRIIEEIKAGSTAPENESADEADDEPTVDESDVEEDVYGDSINQEFQLMFPELYAAESPDEFVGIMWDYGFIDDEQYESYQTDPSIALEFAYAVFAEQFGYDVNSLRLENGVLLTEMLTEESAPEGENDKPASDRDGASADGMIPPDAGHALVEARRKGIAEGENALFEKVNDAYKYIEDATGAEPDITGALVWLAIYGGNGDAAASGTTTRLLEAFKGSVSDTAVTGSKRSVIEELYLSQLSRCVSVPDVSEEQAGEIYDSYIAIDAEGFEQRALETVQRDPASGFAAQLINVLRDKGRSADIAAKTVFNSVIIEDDGSHPRGINAYKLLSLIQEICYDDGVGEGLCDEVMELVASDEDADKWYKSFCEDYSMIKDFWEVNEGLCEYLDYDLLDTSYDDEFLFYTDDSISGELKDRVYTSVHGRYDPFPYWDSDLISGYYGTTSFKAATPQDDLYIIVYDSEEYEGFDDDVRSALEDCGLFETCNPNDAKVAAYVSEYYNYAGSYNTTGNSSYRSTYSAYVSIKFVNTVTGASIGSMSLKNTPQIGGSDFWEDDSSIHMYFPQMDDSDYDTLNGYAEAAAAIVVPSDEPAEGEGEL